MTDLAKPVVRSPKRAEAWAKKALARIGGLVPAAAPAPGTPAYNPAWYALTQIWWDPGNSSGLASNTNSGATALSPLLTWQEIQRRYGLWSPQFNNGQSVQIVQMSAQPLPTTDPIFFEPKVTDGGQAILDVVPTALAALATITVNTAKARGAPGTLLTLTLASCPVGVAAGMLAVNSTRSSQAIVDSVGATVVMQQPQTTASLLNTAILPAPVSDDSWTTGDSVQFYVLSRCNLKRWRPMGGDETSALQPCGGSVFEASITDTSGNDNSQYLHGNASACNVLVNCVVNCRTAFSSEAGRGQGLYSVGCSHVGLVQMWSPAAQVYGGAFANGANIDGGGPNTWTNDSIVHGTINANQGVIQPGNFYSDGSFVVAGCVQVGSSAGFAWGSYSVNVSPGGIWSNGSGSTFVLKGLLTSGTLKLNGVATGSIYTAGTGLWVGGNAITPAALDAAAGHAMSADDNSGARFCVLFGST